MKPCNSICISICICICILVAWPSKEVAQPVVDRRKVFQEPVPKLHTVQCSQRPKGEFKEAELSIWSKMFTI